MTTIVAVEDVTGITVRADRRTTAGDRAYNGPGMQKVIKRAEYILAVTGEGPRPDAVLTFLPPPPETGMKIPMFLRQEFVPALRRHFEINGLPTTGTDDGLLVLVAVHGLGYLVDGDGVLLIPEDGVLAIGSGAPFFRGALATGTTPGDAMDIAVHLDPNSGPPIDKVRQDRPGVQRA